MRLDWVKRWRRRGWRSDKREPVANTDLWKRMLALCEKHQVEFVVVEGHAGHPEIERCAQLAYAALAHVDRLEEDAGYAPKESSA